MSHLLVGQEDYWAGYNDSISRLRDNKEAVEFDKLCFHVFVLNEDGKKLIEHIKEKVIMTSTPGKLNGQFGEACIYYEGYKEAYRQLIAHSQNYIHRKERENKEALAVKESESMQRGKI